MCPSRSLSQSAREFLAWLALRAKTSTVKWYRMYLERFIAHLKDKAIRAVTRLDIETFSAKHHPLTAVCRFLRWASSVAGFMTKDPTAGVKVPTNGRRRRTLTRRERIVLRRKASSSVHWRPLSLLMLAMEESACRPGEARAFLWSDLRTLDGRTDPDDAALASGICFFELEDFKGASRRKEKGGSRIVPISPRFGRMLVRMRRQLPAGPQVGHVFGSRRRRSWSANGFRCSWRTFRASLEGIDGLLVAGLVPYLYRHTRATSLALAGVNSRLLADFLGHAGLAMISVYVHSSRADLCAIGRLPK